MCRSELRREFSKLLWLKHPVKQFKFCVITLMDGPNVGFLLQISHPVRFLFYERKLEVPFKSLLLGRCPAVLAAKLSVN